MATECVIEGGRALFPFSVIAEDANTTSGTGDCRRNRVSFIFHIGPMQQGQFW